MLRWAGQSNMVRRRSNKKAKAPKVILVSAKVNKKRKKSRGRKLVRMPSSLVKSHRDYMDLISNPCHGPLTSGFAAYGGSITERFRKTYSISNTTSTCGYVIWFPSYHNTGAVSTATASGTNAFSPGNLVWFDNAIPSYAPLNTTASPFGLDAAVATSAKFLIDPAFVPVNDNNAYSRGRTLSACVQLEYLGSTSSTQGQVAVIRNASFLNINRSSSNSLWAPPSVDDIFNYSALIERTQLSGHEVVWRPSEDATVLRGSGMLGTAAIAVAAKADTAFWAGSATNTNTVISCADPQNACGVVIAWRGFPPAVGNVSVNVVKVVELELASRNNTVEGMPLSSKSTAHIDECVSTLDKVNPSWQLGSVVTDAAMALGKKAATNAALYAMGRASSMLDASVNSVYAPGGYRYMGSSRNRSIL